MKILDSLVSANSNLLKSKTRTFLTTLAMIIGTVTLTLTVAIGYGANDYINKQVATFNIKNGIFVQKEAPGLRVNSFNESTVPKYDSSPQINDAANDLKYQLNPASLETLQMTKGIKRAYPNLIVAGKYITLDGTNKYIISLASYFKEEHISLAAGYLHVPMMSRQ